MCALVIGVPRTVTSPPHGARATNDPSALARRTASTIPLGVTTAPAVPPASAGHRGPVVVVVLGAVVDVDVAAVLEVDDTAESSDRPASSSDVPRHATADAATTIATATTTRPRFATLVTLPRVPPRVWARRPG